MEEPIPVDARGARMRALIDERGALPSQQAGVRPDLGADAETLGRLTDLGLKVWVAR